MKVKTILTLALAATTLAACHRGKKPPRMDNSKLAISLSKPAKGDRAIYGLACLGCSAMKMEVMLRRSKFRDYYDIYSLLEAGEDLHKMIEIALKYSGHRLKSKNLIAMLTRSDRFVPDSNFPALNPIYDVTPTQIENRIRKELQQ